MLKKSAKITLWTLGAALFVMLIAVASFFDLQISQAIASETSLFGWFFEYLGDSIAYVLAVVALTVFLGAVPRKEKFWLWALTAVGVFAVCLVFFVWFTTAFFREMDFIWVYRVAMALAMSVFLCFLADGLDKQLMQKLALFALFTLLIIGLSQLFTQGAKLLWLRLRFRNMADGAGFTPWYQLNIGAAGREAFVVSNSFQPEDAFKSFPSGHTAGAASLFSLIILPYIFKDKMKKGAVLACYLVPWVVTAVIALSRIVNGAHFLSDVTFGALSGIISAIVVKALIIKIIANRGSKAKSEAITEG